jgi:hypothetical protein
VTIGTRPDWRAPVDLAMASSPAAKASIATSKATARAHDGAGQESCSIRSGSPSAHAVAGGPMSPTSLAATMAVVGPRDPHPRT